MKRTLSAILIAALCCFTCFAIVGCESQSDSEQGNDPTEFVEGSDQSKQVQSDDKSSEKAETAEKTEKIETPAMTSEMKAARKAVRQLVDGQGENVAVSVAPLDGGKGFSVNGNEKITSASMIKLLILAEFLNEVDDGKIDLGASYALKSDDVVGGTGKIQSERKASYTYDELAHYMIMYSDNTASNILIDTMGMDAINARATTLGLENTDLQRKMMQLNTGVENHMSTNDATTLLAGFYNHTIASDAMCAKAEEYLKDQTDAQGLVQGIPSGVAFGHKTGDLDRIRHDGGIVYADKPYTIVMFNKLDAGTANALMSQVSSAVYEALEQGGQAQ